VTGSLSGAVVSAPVASGAVSVMAKVAPNVPDCENNSTPE